MSLHISYPRCVVDGQCCERHEPRGQAVAGNSRRGELDGLVPHGRPTYDRRHQEEPHQARGDALEVGQNRVAKSNITRCRWGRVLVCASVEFEEKRLSYHIRTIAICNRGFTERSTLEYHFATNVCIQVTSKAVSSPEKLHNMSLEDPIATILWQSLDNDLVCKNWLCGGAQVHWLELPTIGQTETNSALPC